MRRGKTTVLFAVNAVSAGCPNEVGGEGNQRQALSSEWVFGEVIRAGGFGRVYAVTSDGEDAVAKLVPKDPGADRELLFVNLGDIRNVVPII
jgi:serine/threonine-protein kinase